MKAIIIMLLLTAAASATEINFQKDETTSFYETVIPFRGNFAEPTLTSICLDFNRPIRAQSNSSFEIGLVFNTVSGLTMLRSPQIHLLDLNNNLVPVPGAQSIYSPDLMFIRGFQDNVLFDGVRFDFLMPAAVIAFTELYMRSWETRPFTIQAAPASVPDNGGGLLLGIIAAAGLFGINFPKHCSSAMRSSSRMTAPRAKLDRGVR